MIFAFPGTSCVLLNSFDTYIVITHHILLATYYLKNLLFHHQRNFLPFLLFCIITFASHITGLTFYQPSCLLIVLVKHIELFLQMNFSLKGQCLQKSIDLKVRPINLNTVSSITCISPKFIKLPYYLIWDITVGCSRLLGPKMNKPISHLCHELHCH